MELHTRRRGIAPNPELEAIRDKVLQECANKNYDWVQELISKTSKIHAGFLFEDEKALQDLCLFIGETQNKVTDPGWVKFGYYLGLNPSVLKVINHNNFNKEDPTYNTLLAFVQFEDATIGRIIKALWDIERLDVISRMRNSINDLACLVLRHTNNDNFNINSSENSDYGSLQMSNERNTISHGSDSDFGEDMSIQNGNINIRGYDIIKPLVIPPAPFIFQNIKTTPELTSQRIQQALVVRDASYSENQSMNITDSVESQVHNKTEDYEAVQLKTESMQISGVNNIAQYKAPGKKKYGKIIMLTFASDGEKYAEEICKVLRRERDCYPKIGVLVLNEHVKEVMKDPHNFITGSFHQVDYVCPILTDSYFKLISRKEKTIFTDLHLDARYVPFTYSLMSNYYVSNGCLNDKIRCIIPDELVSKLRCNLLMSIPIFSAWVKLSEVDDMAVRLLKNG